MADDTRVVRESDVLVLVVYSISFHGTLRSRFIVDDKRARDVDLDGARVGDGLQATGTLAARGRVWVRLGTIGRGHDAWNDMGKKESRGMCSGDVGVPTLTAYISFYPWEGSPLAQQKRPRITSEGNAEGVWMTMSLGVILALL